MKNTIAIIAALIIVATFASCDRQLVQKNHKLEYKLQEKTRHANEFSAELDQKKLETSRLKSEIAKRDKQIEALQVMVKLEKAENEDLKKEIKQLTETNEKQKQQLKVLQDALQTARSDRDFWSDKFHTTIRNVSQLIQMKDGIIKRQKLAIEEQNEMMIKAIQQRDRARACCNEAIAPIIKELP